MADAQAQHFYQQRDFVGLFRYLNAMWIVVMLEVLDDLLDRGFIPNPGNYQSQLNQAGIYVERMEVAMAAVLHKRGRSITWDKFWELHQAKLLKLPGQQQREIREYWKAGRVPGLEGGSKSPVTIGQGGDWFVTAFGGTTTSAVVGAGFTAIEGNITFTQANGTKYSNAIGIMGPSVGVSLGPKFTKLPGISKLARRFPVVAQFLAPDSEGLSTALLQWLMKSANPVARALWAKPVLNKAISGVRQIVNGVSVGPASLPSPAIGLVCGNNGITLQKGSFAGSCIMIGVSGTLGVPNAGVYLLAFGMKKLWNPVTDPTLSNAKGFALISAASAGSVQIPALGAGATIFWGEIV